MLRMMTQVDDHKMVVFLLDNVELSSVGLWERLCTEDRLLFHENRVIREHCFSILHNIVAVGHQEDI